MTEDVPETSVSDRLWRRVADGDRALRTKLTFAAIAAAAVRIADAEGLDRLTLRRLADDLGVATMALYRYVSNKDEVFELMADAAEADPVAEIAATWRQGLLTFARARRASLREHAWLIELPPRAQAALTPRRFANLEAGLATLDGVDIHAGAKKAILDIVIAYTTGVALAETARSRLMAHEGWQTTKAMYAALGPTMGLLLGSGAYPRFADYIRNATKPENVDAQFEAGLEALLDGIASKFQLSAAASEKR